MRRGVSLLLVLLLAGCGADGGAKKERSCDVSQGNAELAELETDKTYHLAFRTNRGAFTVELDTEAGPCASASMVALARKGYFDGTRFHRIVPGFVIQGGDPTASGTGGPGYQTVDTPPSDARYTKGVVAMAKAPQEPAGTAGSQFFVVTAPDAQLPPEYAILGRVVEGLDVVEQIGQLGGPDEQPTERVEIESAEVTTR